ncbi:response regulator [Lachnotalea glycerini]|uniref:Stage 0 sporulation protein A homolog n=1 Tax=Lachnotalea glycerini TaxID=1763509 RepID=A0A371JGX3_9FIRM|nr:response regulator [Lachnotalea glycerini]RDY31985.1 response regulator [Lachnotalea glycerini]
MIRLIIVEDEKLIRNGIEKHVPWNKLGVNLVLSAENAEEAFQMCKELKPDIIISDIMMPGINGIQLCHTFRKTMPESQIIFISGYSDKAYLKAAIELKAVSYVEKPISMSELQEAIKKAVESVQRLRRQSTNLLHTLLGVQDAETDSIVEAIKLSDKGKVIEQDSTFRILVLHTKNKTYNATEFNSRCQEYISDILLKAGIHYITDFAKKDLFVLLLSGPDQMIGKDSAIMSVCWSALSNMRKEEEEWFWGIGKEVQSLEKVSDSYQSALECIQLLSFKGWNNYAFYNEPYSYYQENLPLAHQNEFHKALLDKDIKRSTFILESIFQMLIDGNVVLNFNVRNIYNTLDRIILQSGRERNLIGFQKQRRIKQENEKFLDGVETIEEMHSYVKNHMKEILKENECEQKNNFAVKHVIDYILENYADKEINIQILASVVYLTPTYLSNLFKKKTGVTIGQYITEIRLKKAEELLNNPRLKLYQIADMVGYEDANYFAKLFKKKTGMMPSEYRENIIV